MDLSDKRERREVCHLMRAADEIQIVAVEELAHHISTKGEGDAAVILTPTLNVLIRV